MNVENESHPQKDKKVLVVIPARGGSKGVPRKNLRILGGKPLIAYAIETSLQSKYSPMIIVSSDDNEILSVARKYGAETPFIRPSELSGDAPTLPSAVQHAYFFLKEQGYHFDVVANIQPTSPFLSTKSLDEGLEKIMVASNCDSVVSVAEVKCGHPYITKRIFPDTSYENFCSIPEDAVVTPRQSREKAYYLTGGLYIRRSRFLEEVAPEGHCLGENSLALILDSEEAIDINTEHDLKFAEFILQDKGASS
jgi:CMP-N-acetylneuraminic acid synthetase